MIEQKVSQEYINGFSDFRALLKMIEVAASAVSPQIRTDAGLSWSSVMIEDHISCSIYYDKHRSIKIEAWGKNHKSIYSNSLNLDDVHFFSLSKDEQYGEISKFVKDKSREAKMAIDQVGKRGAI
jgi:hypothetical protein